jgi:hypothetical protein
MNLKKDCNLITPRLVVALGVMLLAGSTMASAQKKAAPAPAPKAAAPAKAPAAATHTAGPGGAKPSTPGTTARTGPTTGHPGGGGVTTGRPGGGPVHPAGPGGGPGHPMEARRPGGPEPHGGFNGRPEPRNTMHETRGGAEFARRPGGGVRDGRLAGGMNVHHNLNGERRFERERADHSRIVVEHGGRGYVQHPYMYHGREFGRRTYYHDGRVYDRYYGAHYYRGVYVNYYTPAYYYRPAFYGWAYNPWVTPVPYAWGWGGNPWYGYYGYYFTPYPVYPSASAWLTDYMISASLAAAYANAQAQAGGPPPGAAPLTPEVKDMISAEVQRQIALENSEAQNAQTAPPDPASSSIQRMLTDNIQHVFLVGHSLDVVNAVGNECEISQGDALQLLGVPMADSPNASLLILSSKGGIECQKNETVTIQIADLQEMQNSMREAIGVGMGELQSKQGSGGLPALPVAARGEPVKAGFMTDAPAPDATVKDQLAQEYNQGVNAENQALTGGPSATPAGGGTAVAAVAPPPMPPPAPTQIELGQTVDQVTAALGPPLRVANLSPRIIYFYKDMKITFKAGKVADVQ